MMPAWFRYLCHCHVLGRTQLGKSRFLEYCIRQIIKHSKAGLTLIDPHGSLYRAIVEYLAYLQPERRIILLNLSRPDFIDPFNPFELPPGRDVSAHVSRIASVLLKVWGAENTNELPTYERIVKMLLTFCAVTGEPLHHGARLLEYPKKELREYAIEKIPDTRIKEQWKRLQYVSLLKHGAGFREWLHEVQSTENRLGRFIGSKNIARFTGLPNQVSVNQVIEDNAILLVNLQPSPSLSEESGKVFASLLVSEFLNAAIEHADTERPHFLIIDEAHTVITSDVTNILDQVAKAGLRLTLAHHHPGQIDDEHLRDSLDTNAPLKVIFGGLPYEWAVHYVHELMLSELNERWWKEDRYRYFTDYVRKNSTRSMKSVTSKNLPILKRAF